MPKKKKTAPRLVVPLPAVTERTKVLSTNERSSVEDATTAIQGRVAVLAVAIHGLVQSPDGYVPELFESGVEQILEDIARETSGILETVGFTGGAE